MSDEHGSVFQPINQSDMIARIESFDHDEVDQSLAGPEPASSRLRMAPGSRLLLHHRSPRSHPHLPAPAPVAEVAPAPAPVAEVASPARLLLRSPEADVAPFAPRRLLSPELPLLRQR